MKKCDDDWRIDLEQYNPKLMNKSLSTKNISLENTRSASIHKTYNDIRIENNCDVRENRFTYYDFKPGEYCFEDTTGHKRLLFTGNNSFLVKEIEVFLVIKFNLPFFKIILVEMPFPKISIK